MAIWARRRCDFTTWPALAFVRRIVREHQMRRFLGLAGLFLLVLGAAPARAAGPADVVDAFYGTLLDVMKNADTLKFEGRYQKLKPAIEQAFDLPLMTRLTVGPPWQNVPAEQQQRLVQAFENFTVATYADRFNGYSGEKFVVEPQTQQANSGTIVRTQLIKSDGEPVQLNYLMRQSSGAWKIIDVFLSGTVSELASRRSEFSSVLRRDGADGLVRLLEQRAAALKKPG
jgi:phospholipid transport system substrate-binding protein